VIEKKTLRDNPEDEISQKYLDKVEYVCLLRDKTHVQKQDKLIWMIYLLEDKGYLEFTLAEMMRRDWKEIQYALYLLNHEVSVTKEWRQVLGGAIAHQIKRLNLGLKAENRLHPNKSYVPKYVYYDDSDVEMKKGMAKIEKSEDRHIIDFNPNAKDVVYIDLKKNLENVKVNHLRACIYQMDESDLEMAQWKEKLKAVLARKEKELFKSMLYGLGFEQIKD